MKRSVFMMLAFSIISASLTTMASPQEKPNSRQAKKVAEWEAVKKTIESGKYTVNFTRMTTYGLNPKDKVLRYSSITINGKTATINLIYQGATYYQAGQGTSGIKVKGDVEKYDLSLNDTKRVYTVKLKVKEQMKVFDAELSFNSSGSCDLFMSTLALAAALGPNYKDPEQVSYNGRIVPAGNKGKTNQSGIKTAGNKGKNNQSGKKTVR